MSKQHSAPYDERNAEDYEQISRRINRGIKEAQNDPNVPVTQDGFAKYIRVSRGTLRNRGVAKVLKLIKDQRRKENLSGRQKGTQARLTSIETHIEDKRLLAAQLEKSRTEVAIWVDKFSEAQRESKLTQRLTTSLKKENASQKEQIYLLKAKVHEVEEALKVEKAKNTVVPFKRPKKR